MVTDECADSDSSSDVNLETTRANYGAAHIQFEDIEYAVKEYKYGVWSSGATRILHRISGRFEAGKITALMGESGSGKTSLMDIISGYRSKDVNGQVLVDDMPQSSSALIKYSCYVRQDTVVQPLLTPYEAIMFVINMKLTPKILHKQKEAIALKFLKKSMLLKTKNTLTKNLSGGEQKRLALALELVSNPSVIILDEPTSGLDSLATRECLKMLRELSEEGRTIICSIHQASMSLLQLFDNLYIMWKGCCLYQGAVDNLVPFLSAHNFPCPLHYNPTEYMLELCTMDATDNGHTLRDAIHNGKSLDWMQKTAPTKAVSFSVENANEEESTKLENMSTTTSPFAYQLVHVLKRKALITSRDMLLCWLTLAACTAEGIGMGVFFYNKGNDAEWVLYNYNMIYFLTLSALFNGLMSRIITFPLEFQILKHEYFNRWYSLKTYWLALMISDTPILIISSTFLCVSFYYLAGFPLEQERILRFTGIIVALTLLSQDYGIFLGTVFSMKNGLVFGVFSTSPMLMFSGFFIYYRDCPFEWFRLGFKVSPLRMVFQEAVVSVYGYDREALLCNKIFCPYTYPELFIEQVDMKIVNKETFWPNLTFILVLALVFKILGLTMVKYKCSRGV